jgi:hypothetical protein
MRREAWLFTVASHQQAGHRRLVFFRRGCCRAARWLADGAAAVFFLPLQVLFNDNWGFGREAQLEFDRLATDMPCSNGGN